MAEAPEHLVTVRDPGPAATPSSLPSSEAYRPLSLLAIAGFALAVLYAVVVIVGGLAVLAGRHAVAFRLLLVLVPLGALLVALLRQGRQPGQIASFVGLAVAAVATVLGLGSLVAYSGSNPWLLPNFMWAVVLAAGVISWVALGRIQASEGTLSGTALARWGLGLSLFFGINYAAYLASNVLAVRRQARDCAEDFLEQIKQGDINAAFIRTLESSSRPPAGADPRPELEVKHNMSRSADGGPYSLFGQSDLARLVTMGGTSTKFEPRSAAVEFDGGTYKATLQYRATTFQGSFDVTVTAWGKDAAGLGRRQWYIVQGGTGVVPPLAWTDEGVQMNALSPLTREFARAWGQKLRANKIDEAYLDTVPPQQRLAQTAAWRCSTPAVLGAAGLAPLSQWTQGATGDAFREGRKAFSEARLLDVKDFWSDRRYRKDMLDQVRQVFAGTVPVPVDIEPTSGFRVPITRTVNNHVQQGITCRMMFAEPTGGSRYTFEAEVIIEAPLTPTPPPLESLRVVSMRLIRGQTAPPIDATPTRPRR
jgi:hypothetical protein